MSDLLHRIKTSLEPILELADPRERISAYHDMPYALFRYEPEEEFELRKQITLLETRLTQKGKRISRISLAECLDEAMRSQRPLEDWFDIDHGQEVFPPNRWDVFSLRKRWRFFQALQHYKYKAHKLETLLKFVFSERTLGDAQRRLCVPSFDGFTEVNVFKTPHHFDYRMDWNERVLTVAMATAAAPSYFPVYKNGGRFFADGGVWANNPVMIGLVDALVCYELDRRQVHILSLGTGDTEIRFTENQIIHGGLVDWYEIISSAMHLQSQNATGQAGLLIGRDQLFRLNAPPMPDDPIALDDYDRARSELPAIAAQLVSAHGQAIQDRFLFEEAEPYPAFYGPRASIDVKGFAE
jgi:hypothetical protein